VGTFPQQIATGSTEREGEGEGEQNRRPIEEFAPGGLDSVNRQRLSTTYHATNVKHNATANTTVLTQKGMPRFFVRIVVDEVPATSRRAVPRAGIRSRHYDPSDGSRLKGLQVRGQGAATYRRLLRTAPH
jgi:hypothetical protein